ncbi:MAG: M20/M25/M40 family metallo-hydrolase [Lachnospiraceae bacterium]|uniref:M20/M25/M40 family metallo-hydrolase n=1 Tax=Candidatus Weimeria bifida TaxID=2599074 RepID=A0A6N7IYR1_9FIRM|nr:M20/M25/M40 family metallo-hydrolase [Candidatus Weimeria bifida]RRF95386.1 MAG: M20/M25/M40 family metallo-hydrolase [Lachnospiraceae bacterium]
MEDLTKDLVRVKSINGTEGEKDIGLFLEKRLREIPYFKDRPNQVITKVIDNDPLCRRSVFALLKGHGGSKKTVILHGHTDTVGLSGYGKLADFACDPDRLQEEMARLDKLGMLDLSDEVRADLKSADYMFGRGSSDMKSGDAVFIILLEELSASDTLNGNLLLMLNPVEENLHTGVIDSIDVLLDLKEKYNLDYVLAINNDFTCPSSPDDRFLHIYTGVGGKILPSFYIHGRETHVGQCFEGLDASAVAAAILERIQLSRDFCDTEGSEPTFPPSVLKIKDLKKWYNVQTAAEALVYFNYYVHEESMDSITKKLLHAAEEAYDTVESHLNAEAQWFFKMRNEPYKSVHYKKQILTYDDLYKLTCERCPGTDIPSELEKICENELSNGTDLREIPVAMIRYLIETAGITEPAVVLYYAAPYCPHNTFTEKDGKLMDIIRESASEVGKKYSVSYKIHPYYPSLSDSSYLRIDDDDSSVAALRDNFPAMNKLYPIPVDKIKKLNIPAVNLGTYGKDAHKWTERVNLPVTMHILPDLIREVLRHVFTVK